jgi:hypothetical protein
MTGANNKDNHIPEITQFNARKRTVIFIADLNHERMNTIFFLIDNELSIDQSVSGQFADRARPPLNT